MHVKIRVAQAQDFETVMALYRQLQPEDPVLSQGQDRAAFDTILLDPKLHLLLLDVEGQTRSTCYLNIIPNITRAARPYAIIENVVTNLADRGQGFGKRVISAALAQAWAAGCYKVMLQTGSKRASTLAFYAACGFSGTDKQAFVAWRPNWSAHAD